MKKKEMIDGIVVKSSIKNESSIKTIRSRMNRLPKEFLADWYPKIGDGSIEADYFVFCTTGIRRM